MDGADNVSLPQIAGRQMLDRRRQAVWGWDTAVGEARRIEGYGHFPCPGSFADLTRPPTSGPCVSH